MVWVHVGQSELGMGKREEFKLGLGFGLIKALLVLRILNREYGLGAELND